MDDTGYIHCPDDTDTWPKTKLCQLLLLKYAALWGSFKNTADMRGCIVGAPARQGVFAMKDLLSKTK